MKEFKNKIQNLYEPKLNNQTVLNFRQLISYIDTAITDTFKKPNEDITSSLVNHLMSIRNYMATNVTENGLRITFERL